MSWVWWGTPLIPALQTQRHVDLCAFKVILVNKVPGRPRLLYKESLSWKTKLKQTKTLIRRNKYSHILHDVQGTSYKEENTKHIF